MKINLNNNKDKQIKQQNMNQLDGAFFHLVRIEKYQTSLQ